MKVITPKIYLCNVVRGRFFFLLPGVLPGVPFEEGDPFDLIESLLAILTISILGSDSSSDFFRRVTSFVD